MDQIYDYVFFETWQQGHRPIQEPDRLWMLMCDRLDKYHIHHGHVLELPDFIPTYVHTYVRGVNTSSNSVWILHAQHPFVECLCKSVSEHTRRDP
jgi:hypothetical protein